MLSIAQQTNRLADAFADKHVPGAHAHALEKISIIDDAFCCLLFVVCCFVLVVVVVVIAVFSVVRRRAALERTSKPLTFLCSSSSCLSSLSS